LGPNGARILGVGTIVGAYVSLPVLWLVGVVPSWALLALATAPLAVPPLRAVARGGDLPPGTVERTAMLHMFFGAAYAAGLALAAVL
jgi:1,4-dihydroxy-2-naphthoate octaprenyltransferase